LDSEKERDYYEPIREIRGKCLYCGHPFEDYADELNHRCEVEE
jgi:5-methylcytosine-specific restriction endonuclease McrA